MPYRFKAGESVPENVRRIAIEEIDSAVAQLRTREGKKRDEAIHEARKSVKKIRGLLKLMRPELGGVYREENDALRDLGRQLSELRDVGAVIETFDGIVHKHEGTLDGNEFRRIRKALERSKREKERAENVARVMTETASGLKTVRLAVPEWPLRADGFGAIADGLKESYRRGRRAMQRARAKSRPELYHEWRKRAKDHWYHVRLLENAWSEVMRAREASLHELETGLGDDHNIVVLSQQLQREPGVYGTEDEVQLFLTLARARQKELREKALSLGDRIYEAKPKLFTKALKGLWQAWQAEPESVTHQTKAERKPPKKTGAGAKETAA